VTGLKLRGEHNDQILFQEVWTKLAMKNP
jgi:hypothetical protein